MTNNIEKFILKMMLKIDAELDAPKSIEEVCTIKPVSPWGRFFARPGKGWLASRAGFGDFRLRVRRMFAFPFSS